MLVRLLVGILRLIGLTLRGLLRLLRTKVGLLLLLGLAVYFGARGVLAPALRVGTFNIERFGPGTDLRRLSALLMETEADVLALQEIQNRSLLDQLAAQLSSLTHRQYQVAVSACGGRQSMHVGFLYDAKKLQLDGLREFPELQEGGEGSCWVSGRSGLLAIFSPRTGLLRSRTYLLTVHFPAGNSFGQAQARQAYWTRALRIATQLRQGGNKRVIILGDVNSTGYREDTYGERRAIHTQLDREGLRMLTSGLDCSAYWQPPGRREFVPGHLDHIIAVPEFHSLGTASLHGYCAALRCQPAGQLPMDYWTVSDHCPVTVDVR